MRCVSNLVVATALAGALAGCGDPYYPRYGYSQASSYPSNYYSYPSGYAYYPSSGYAYYPSSYSYYSYPSGYGYRNGYAYRNYNGIHPGPDQTW